MHFLRSTGVTGLIVALIAVAVAAVSLTRGSAPASVVLSGPSAVASSILTEPSAAPSRPTGPSARPSTSPSPSGTPSAGPSASTPPQTQQAQSAPAGGPASSAPGAPSPFEPTSADLHDALLSAAQIGDGFTEQSAGASLPASTVAQCPALNELQTTADAEADASFSSSSLGPYVTETLLQYSVPEAQAQIAQFAEVAHTCADMQFSIDGLDIDASLSIEPFPASGDQTTALLLSADIVDYGVVINGEIVGVRHGGTVIVISNVGYPLDSSLTPGVVSQAYANVAARW